MSWRPDPTSFQFAIRRYRLTSISLPAQRGGTCACDIRFLTPQIPQGRLSPRWWMRPRTWTGLLPRFDFDDTHGLNNVHW
jgi:hypothetical protein